MTQPIDIEIMNRPPCRNSDAVGSYLCQLHQWGMRGIEHSDIQVGNHNPANFPIGTLAAALLRNVDDSRNKYPNKLAVPFARLIGMSVVRLCMHPQVSSGQTEYVELQGEVIGSLAFVEDSNKFYHASYGHGGPRISPKGVSTQVMVTTPSGADFRSTQHLLTTPENEKKFPVAYAAPSLAHSRLHKDAWVALRPMPEETRFVETLVSREELLDTLDLSV